MSKTKWTTDNIPDLTGKVIIVTGGNSGLGYEAVKAFADKGAQVIMASRNLQKAEAATKEIVKGHPSGKVIIMELDLGSLESVKNFVGAFKKQYNQLNVLVNNAGIMMTPYQLTNDGFESQLGTNHFGHFALTGQLFDLIKKTPGSRIVNVSSIAHKKGTFDFNDLLYDDGKSYDPMKAYQRSKIANLLFTYELQRKLDGSSVTMAVAAHPGVSMTNLANHLKGSFMFKIFSLLSPFVAHPVANGALPEIRASVDPEVKPGTYYGPAGFNEMKGAPVVVQSNSASHNKQDAQKLWEVSEKLTGVTFDFS